MTGRLERLVDHFKPRVVPEQAETPDPNLLTYQDIAKNPQRFMDFLGKKWRPQVSDYGWDFVYAPKGEQYGDISFILTPSSASLVLHMPLQARSLNQFVKNPTYRIVDADNVRTPERYLIISSPNETIHFYPESMRSERWIKDLNGLRRGHDHIPFGALLETAQKPA